MSSTSGAELADLFQLGQTALDGIKDSLPKFCAEPSDDAAEQLLALIDDLASVADVLYDLIEGNDKLNHSSDEDKKAEKKSKSRKSKLTKPKLTKSVTLTAVDENMVVTSDVPLVPQEKKQRKRKSPTKCYAQSTEQISSIVKESLVSMGLASSSESLPSIPDLS